MEMQESPGVARHAEEERAPDEFREAVRRLSDTNWERLRRIAMALAVGRTLEGEDLMQEAMARVLDGGRPWPRNVEILPFLAGVMRSVAHGERAKIKRSSVRQPISLYSPAGDLAIDPVSTSASPEEAVAEDEEWSRVRQGITVMFGDDYDAQVLLEGIMEGLEGEDLRGLTGLDLKGFASKRRLIQRRLTKLKANGGPK
jgi:DNA-directed RNA polymerase specialized sigma24 family protein